MLQYIHTPILKIFIEYQKKGIITYINPQSVLFLLNNTYARIFYHLTEKSNLKIPINNTIIW